MNTGLIGAGYVKRLNFSAAESSPREECGGRMGGEKSVCPRAACTDGWDGDVCLYIKYLPVTVKILLYLSKVVYLALAHRLQKVGCLGCFL